MKRIIFAITFCGLVITTSAPVSAQTLAVDDPVLKQIWTEAMENSQLEVLAHELLDAIGPRLTGSPQGTKAHEWASDMFQSWGIKAENQQWGTWLGWERGITHVDMVEPWVKTLDAIMLAWSPGLKKAVKAEVVIIPDVPDSNAFNDWLPKAKNKIVLISYLLPSGRPDDDWQTNATSQSLEKLQEERNAGQERWNERLAKTGHRRDLYSVLEEAGAAAIISCGRPRGWGTATLMGSHRTEETPLIQLCIEDYGLIYRLTEYGDNPILEIDCRAKFLEDQPVYNTIGWIRGTEKPDEYVLLMGHFDSWDAGTGACDNATGALMAMEALRILHKVYPNPKRTIMVGMWGSEEQGLNGSRAFVEDHPEIVEGLQAGFNQDNGTGRVVRMSSMGFIDAGSYLAKWLARVPAEVGSQIDLSVPGMPSGGGSDHAAFVAVGAPCFSLGAHGWSYGYTWHTQRDTYDKIVFDDWRNNVVLAASLAYLASEESDRIPRTKRVMPINERTGERQEWPTQRKANRKGGNGG